jgi:small multidrug resistance pump
MSAKFYLVIAIIAEVIATSALKASEGFTKVVPLSIVFVGYAIAFYFLALALKDIPVGIAYAIWSGAGIILIALVAMILYKQVPDIAAIIGMALIIAGVIVLNLFSKTSAH